MRGGVKKNARGGHRGGAAGGGGGGRIERFDGKEEGQEYGRVTAMLGDRRVRCFCNDGTERICKIRSRICKRPHKKIINVGDIVLISSRDFSASISDDDEEEVVKETPAVGQKKDSVWDLIDRIEKDDWRTIKKEKGIHPHLFEAPTGPTNGKPHATPIDDIFSDTQQQVGVARMITVKEEDTDVVSDSDDDDINVDAL
jgi:initiation factor 1A